MTKVRVESFSISLDGFGAGPDQSIDHPLGVGGNELHQWFLPTKTFQTMHSEMTSCVDKKGATGVDNDFAARGFKNIGAWILGRNIFGPIRAPGETLTGKAGGAITPLSRSGIRADPL